MTGAVPETQTYIFFRAIGWYPVEAKDDDEIMKHIELNPGTLKVETVDRRIVWSLPNA